ncbi:hypothetical protein ACERIT_06780 [Halopenitus sp. H-Gu1]|uniref:hypothetical protein n=1 Tax=Halopenitus sp. H-Gu1 TaxID=3242697 RepID=UPI00359F0E1F
MPSNRTIGIVGLAFLIGLVVGGVGVSAVLPVDSGSVDPDRPPYSISSGTGCIEQSDDWAFTAPVDPGESSDRTFLVRASIEHDQSRELDARLEHAGEGRYLFVLTTGQAEKSGTPECSDGVYGSTVDLAATLPGDFESVTVVFDGEQVATIENPGDRSPTYQPLSF